LEKDELIRRLVWLQLKDTIDNYQDADDLNAGYESKEKGRGNRSVRMFMNVGTKDGFNSSEDLLRFIIEATDVEPGVIDRITVRDMSSFFNVSATAAEFLQSTLSSKKHKGRKIRVEEAEQSTGFRGGSGGGGGRERSGGGGGRPSYGGSGAGRREDSRPYGNRRGGDDNRSSFNRSDRSDSRGGSHKFNRRNND
jgi:ATP-dependent RNA helicase DeaD